MELSKIQFRIHGDNVVECEVALRMIEKTYEAKVEIVDGPTYAPIYKLAPNTGDAFYIQFLPGCGRWQLT